MTGLKYVFLIGMPRSGTSWLSQIFDSSPEVRFRLSPLFSYALKNAVDIKSSKDEWAEYLDKVYNTEDGFMSQTVRRKEGKYPIFEEKANNPVFLVIKNTRYHNLTERMLELFDDIKIIYIVRHPCGAINSWLKSKKEFPQGADPLKEWKSGKCRKIYPEEFWGFDDWKKVTRMYLELTEKFPYKIGIIKYEDLVNNPIDVTNRVFEFVGIRLTKQTENFLIECHKTHDVDEYAVFKNKNVKDRWKNELNQKIIEKIYKDLKGTELEAFIDE